MLKFRAVAIISALTLALVPTALSAQMPAPRSLVNIPFDFQVGSAHLAAGQYVISNPQNVLLLVQGAKRSAFAITSRETSSTPSKVSKVVFHQLGNQYFLREVWTMGDSEGLSCPQSKAEREARRSQNGDHRASVATPTNVDIAFLESPR
jgi:hypothetical protein